MGSAKGGSSKCAKVSGLGVQTLMVKNEGHCVHENLSSGKERQRSSVTRSRRRRMSIEEGLGGAHRKGATPTLGEYLNYGYRTVRTSEKGTR